VYGHLDDPETSGLERGVTYLRLRPGAPPVHSVCLTTSMLAFMG
jgi:hypothetical protein